MEEGGLTLPTPAASLWRATREAITDALTNIGHPGIYRMGGGTILAARWRHRRSWDIDLQVDPGTDLGKLRGESAFHFLRNTHMHQTVPGFTKQYTYLAHAPLACLRERGRSDAFSRGSSGDSSALSWNCGSSQLVL